MSRIRGSYLIETPDDPERAATMMAGEQSVGTFVRVAGETPELLERYGARVEHVERLTQGTQPSLPGAKNPDARPYAQAEVTLSFPLETIGTSLAHRQSVTFYSARGPDDSALGTTREAVARRSEIGRFLGTAQGTLLADILTASGVRRACVVGGDTCGYAAQRFGIYALELLRPVAPGSPLCLAHSHNETTDGLELSLKAGQVGGDDYFLRIQHGISH